MQEETCSECGAKLSDNKPCISYFHQMITWDFEDFMGAGSVHHITVLSYYLQHPSKYSPEGVVDAILLLKQIIEHQLTEQELFARNKNMLDTKERNWKIKGTSTHHGTYKSPIPWQMTADIVVTEGLEKYVTNVKKWATSIYADLAKSGNL